MGTAALDQFNPHSFGNKFRVYIIYFFLDNRAQESLQNGKRDHSRFLFDQVAGENHFQFLNPFFFCLVVDFAQHLRKVDIWF